MLDFTPASKLCNALMRGHLLSLYFRLEEKRLGVFLQSK